MKISYFTLENGLRGVVRQQPSAVEYCGVVVNVGSRDEDEAHEGLAHFVEHTIFKGTERRRAWHIINRLERIGGELNAYTTKEETVVYACCPRGYLARAAELIADLVSHSRFPTREIDREREVVDDEIASYLDTPSEAVYDDFEEMFYAGSPLAHNILGRRSTVDTFTSEVCQAYLRRFYTPGAMTWFYLGPSSDAKVRGVVERYFGVLDRPDVKRERQAPMLHTGENQCRQLGLHQSHTVIGGATPSLFSPLRHAVAIVTNLLGGPGMNSLLNVALRERRGLVYSVEASTALLTDTGLFTIYYGCDTEDNERCLDLTYDTLQTLRREGISSRKLAAIKRQYLGQLIVASSSLEQMALSTGRSMLYHGRVASPQEIVENIRAVSSDDLQQVIEMLQPERLSRLTFGHYTDC
ncbi:MAG: insulinase family protein [Bacteroidales bacterium]|nr:insulinase family protein [Bacteroidales bacterium]